MTLVVKMAKNVTPVGILNSGWFVFILLWSGFVFGSAGTEDPDYPEFPKDQRQVFQAVYSWEEAEAVLRSFGVRTQKRWPKSTEKLKNLLGTLAPSDFAGFSDLGLSLLGAMSGGYDRFYIANSIIRDRDSLKWLEREELDPATGQREGFGDASNSEHDPSSSEFPGPSTISLDPWQLARMKGSILEGNLARTLYDLNRNLGWFRLSRIWKARTRGMIPGLPLTMATATGLLSVVWLGVLGHNYLDHPMFWLGEGGALAYFAVAGLRRTQNFIDARVELLSRLFFLESFATQHGIQLRAPVVSGIRYARMGLPVPLSSLSELPGFLLGESVKPGPSLGWEALTTEEAAQVDARVYEEKGSDLPPPKIDFRPDYAWVESEKMPEGVPYLARLNVFKRGGGVEWTFQVQSAKKLVPGFYPVDELVSFIPDEASGIWVAVMPGPGADTKQSLERIELGFVSPSYLWIPRSRWNSTVDSRQATIEVWQGLLSQKPKLLKIVPQHSRGRTHVLESLVPNAKPSWFQTCARWLSPN